MARNLDACSDSPGLYYTNSKFQCLSGLITITNSMPKRMCLRGWLCVCMHDQINMEQKELLLCQKHLSCLVETGSQSHASV